MSDVSASTRREFVKVAGSAALGASRFNFKKTDAPEYMKLPDSRAGAMSCLTGIAIRNSIDQHRPARIADLVRI
jgi:hypothetical protein